MDDWQAVEERSGWGAVIISIDFKDWQQTLTKQEKTILSHLMQGYKAKDIADILQLAYTTIRQIIKHLKEMFLEYFRLDEFAYP